MIIIHSKYFSGGKKKTDKETERQKKDRKGLSTTVGLLAGDTAGLVTSNSIMGKLDRDQTKVYQQSGKHLSKIDEKKKANRQKYRS